MMLKRQLTILICCAFVLLAGPWSGHAALAAEKDGGKVAGIYIDGKGDWITVKADGEDEPVKYVIDPSDKKLQDAFKSIFGASRVQLTYKNEGDSRRLVSIKKQVLRASGTVTGEVVKVYNGFWVEVKPKNGLADAYAAGANFKDKDFMERLKGLQPGDSVTITFTTDFERHRIKTLRKNPSQPIESGRLIAIGNTVEGIAFLVSFAACRTLWPLLEYVRIQYNHRLAMSDQTSNRKPREKMQMAEGTI